MRTGDLTSGAAKLHKSWKKLRERWEDTKPHWNDAVSQDFEKKYIGEIEPQIMATLDRMRTLAATLSNAEQICNR